MNEIKKLELSDFSGPSVDLKKLTEPGTQLHVGLAFLLAALVFAFTFFFTMGGILLGLGIGLILDVINRRKTEARLHGNALHVNSYQFPELYTMAKVMATRMGLAQVPTIYIVESNEINAAATRIGARNIILLNDDAVDACLRTGNHDALSFLLAHEMAHHALGHTGMFRNYLARIYKKVSRLDEFSSDTVAAEIVGQDAAFDGLCVLLTGPQLLPYISKDAIAAQAKQVNENKYSPKAERHLTHPLLLRRVAKFC